MKIFVAFFVLGVIAALTGLIFVYFYAKPRQDLAETFDLSEIDDLEVASVILDRHGEEIGRIFVQNREPISIEEVSPNFVRALLAAEDARFYVHDGVDYVGVLRAVWLNLKAREVTQGASTVTQQLARNAFNLKERSLSRKVTEAFLARRIEREFNKDQILELYLNRIYFGSGFYGISAAAKGYFGKEAKDLTVPESAVLAGVIRNPYYRSPFNFPDAAKNTRNYVLKRMYEEDLLQKADYKKFIEEPLVTATRTSAFGQSKYVYERVRQQVIQLIGYERASEGGFQIHTTIDNGVQMAAEKKLVAQLDQIETRGGYPHQTRDIYKVVKKNFLESAAEGAQPPPPEYLQGAALMIDNVTGGIIALVGGRDFNDSMYDRTTQARRPPGTAFTPFVYATAFENGLYPGSLVEDTPMDNKQVQIGGEAGILGEWGTESESIYEGEITARRALAMSRNAATVRVGARVGLEKVVTLAKEAGITFQGDIQNFNATLLGKSETTMEEVCLAYSIFPNKGSHPREIHIISSIEDSTGKSIYAPEVGMSPERPIDAFTAYQISSVLSDALKSGTGKKAYEEYGLKSFPAAGKTGTEYGFTDNWFVGFTSEVTCAVWAGFDQPQTIYPGAFSSETVLPVWADMMNEAAESFEPLAFEPPSTAVKVEICSLSGQLATDACYEVEQNGASTLQRRSTYMEYLRPGTEVTAICEVHGGPGAIPRTGPSRAPDRSLTLRDEGGALRAQPLAATADPIVPVGPTVVGLDPYQSLAPVLRAQVVIPEVEEDDEEAEESEGDTEEEGSGGLIARPLGAAGSDEREYRELDTSAMLRAEPTSDVSSDSPAATRPVARPLGSIEGEEEEPEVPDTGVALPVPKPIEFD